MFKSKIPKFEWGLRNYSTFPWFTFFASANSVGPVIPAVIAPDILTNEIIPKNSHL